jgi:hypothetical protein
MNFRRRLKQSRRKIRCSKCTAIASRFKDAVGFVRVWYCAAHFPKEIENGKEETNIRVSA